MEKRKLYPIGKAAEICKVSPRALRYYEEKGLIRPDEISSSHYRYYTTETLRIVQLIRYYIDEGFSLQETEELLKRDSFDQLEDLFRIQMVKTREEISLQYQRLDSLTAWYGIIREGRQVLDHRDDSVTVKHIPSSMYFYMDAEADLSAPDLNADLETEYFSMYSDISILTILCSSSNKLSANAFANSVFPTPVGPKNRNEPIGLRGSLIPALERIIASDTFSTASF